MWRKGSGQRGGQTVHASMASSNGQALVTLPLCLAGVPLQATWVLAAHEE